MKYFSWRTGVPYMLASTAVPTFLTDFCGHRSKPCSSVINELFRYVQVAGLACSSVGGQLRGFQSGQVGDNRYSGQPQILLSRQCLRLPGLPSYFHTGLSHLKRRKKPLVQGRNQYADLSSNDVLGSAFCAIHLPLTIVTLSTGAGIGKERNLSWRLSILSPSLGQLPSRERRIPRGYSGVLGGPKARAEFVDGTAKSDPLTSPTG